MTLLTATDMKLTAVKSCGKAGKPKKGSVPQCETSFSRKQFSARLREPDERAALVQHQPAAGDRQVEAGLVFCRRGFLRE
jgi:hypothetical protein